MAIGEFTSPEGITTNSTHMLVTDLSDSRIQIFDLVPAVILDAVTPDGDTHNSNIISYTATFSEAVTGFDESNITVSGTTFGGTPVVSDFDGTGTTYTFGRGNYL